MKHFCEKRSMKMSIYLPCSIYVQFLRSERSSSSCSFSCCVFTKHSSNSCHWHHTLLEMDQTWAWFTVTSFHQNINIVMIMWEHERNHETARRERFSSWQQNHPSNVQGQEESPGKSFSYPWEQSQEAFPKKKGGGKIQGCWCSCQAQGREYDV